MDKGFSVLAHTDAVLWEVIESALWRQEDTVELIAAENLMSRAVRRAQGSVLTNKDAAGYPGKRDDQRRRAIIAGRVRALCAEFPVYPSSTTA